MDIWIYIYITFKDTIFEDKHFCFGYPRKPEHIGFQPIKQVCTWMVSCHQKLRQYTVHLHLL